MFCHSRLGCNNERLCRTVDEDTTSECRGTIRAIGDESRFSISQGAHEAALLHLSNRKKDLDDFLDQEHTAKRRCTARAARRI